MLRSLMSGVSGVKGHQVSLDVVGNNIANVNTAGYKRSSLTFQDLLYQTASGAMKPTDERGGVNAQQIGLGVQVGAIEVLHTQGNTQFTGSRTDMAIQGDGYFVVVDGNNKLYSRAGNFVLDASSNLVQAGTGFKVQGYAMERDPVDPTSFTQGSQLVDINIPVGDKMEARATEVAGFRCNLDSRVDTYLPMGILKNDVEINFSLGGNDFSLKVNDPGALGAGGFMTLTSSAPASVGSVGLQFTGINATTGLPILTTTFGGTITAATFDNTTGQLTVTAGGADKVIDLKEYFNLTMFTDSSNPAPAAPVHYLAEFDDVQTTGSRTLRLWAHHDTTPPLPGTVTVNTLTIPMNNDGTFNLSSLTQIIAGPPDIQAQATEDGLGVIIRNTTTNTLLATINQTTASVHSTKMDVYDSLGNPYTLEVSWEKIDNNQWRWRAWLPNDAGITLTDNTGILTFTADGKLERTNATPVLILNFAARGALEARIKLDFSGETFQKDAMEGVTQYGVDYTTKGYYQDGYSMGVMTDFATGKDGTVTGVYNNGVNVPLYRVALALFANSAGLNKEGNTVFSESNNSGMAQIGAAMTGGAGEIAGSSLEMSNVDLTDEFTKLITSQRGFQANARMITTSDQVLEELINLKR